MNKYKGWIGSTGGDELIGISIMAVVSEILETGMDGDSAIDTSLIGIE